MPAAAQRSRMSPSRQRLTLRAWLRMISIIDSTGFVEATVLSSAPVTRSRVTVNMSGSPSRNEPAASGLTLSSWRASVSRSRWASSASGFAQARRSLARTQALPLRQMIKNVAFLVDAAPLDQGVVAVDVADRTGERLAAVEDEQNPLGGIEPAVAQVG